MSGVSQQDIDAVRTEIQQTKQDLVVAEHAEDVAKVAFLRERLLQLCEEEVCRLRAQSPGGFTCSCYLMLPCINPLLHVLPISMWLLQYCLCA